MILDGNLSDKVFRLDGENKCYTSQLNSYSHRVSFPTLFSHADILSDLNALVMNYLITVGYPQSAISFAQESNTSMPSTVSTSEIEERQLIRDLILQGRVWEAMKAVNDIDPAVSQNNLPPLSPPFVPSTMIQTCSCTTRIRIRLYCLFRTRAEKHTYQSSI